MMKHRFIEPDRLLDLFSKIETDLYKYPALNPKEFRSAVERVVHNER
jgi:hypothetical protein